MELVQLKALLVTGLAVWLTLAVINNILDSRTNLTLLGQMMSMEELRRDGVLGQGLLTRAVAGSGLPRLMLSLVIVAQLCVAALLWRAGYLLGFGPAPGLALAAARLALLSFASIWLFFLCGGMWFGYWIKMPQVQIVHMTLLTIAIGVIVVVHL